MARNITVTFEDGTTHQYANAPDTITPADIEQRATNDFGLRVTNIDGGRQDNPPPVAPRPSEQSTVGSMFKKYLLDPANQIAGAVVEPALTMATSAIAKPVSDIAGLASIPAHALGLTQIMPENVKASVQNALQYQPQTKAGKITTMPIQAIGSGIEGLANAAVSDIENPLVKAGLKEAFMQAPAFIGAKRVPALTAKAATEQAMNIKRDTIRSAGQQAGLIAPPEGGIVRKTLAKAGKAEDAVSLKNKATVTNMMAQDVGLPVNTPIDMNLITQRRNQLNADYNAVANAFPQGVTLSTGLTNKLKTMSNDLNDKLSSAPTTYSEFANVAKVLEEQLAKPTTARTMQSVMDDVAALRGLADAAFAKGEKRAGSRYREIADAYEQNIAANLKSRGSKELYDNFVNARQQHAKLYLLQDVVDEGGLVDFAALRNRTGATLSKKKINTGATKVAADFAHQFPTVTKNLTPDQVAGIGKWEATVPAMSAAGLFTGAGTGSTLAGVGAAALPALMSVIAPKLGTAGLLQRNPSYSHRFAAPVYGTVGISPFTNPNQQGQQP